MKRLNQTKQMLEIKKLLQQEPKDKEITKKQFKKLYNFNVNLLTRCPSTEKYFMINTILKKDGWSELETIKNGTYEILINNQWIKIDLKNIKKYAYQEKNCDYYYYWKKTYTARLTISQYYYSYSDIIMGLNKKINNNIFKEKKKVLRLENQKLRLCEYFDNQISDLKNTIQKLEQF